MADLGLFKISGVAVNPDTAEMVVFVGTSKWFSIDKHDQIKLRDSLNIALCGCDGR